MRKLILASASKRRVDLLEQMGISFRVIPADVDERAEGSPEEMVKQIALRKALAVHRSYPQDLVLAADTLVFSDGQPLGKPEDAADAARMLKLLSGREHSVYTGLCLMGFDLQLMRVAETAVKFVDLTPEDVTSYIASGEPFGKSGAYAVQGRGGMFVSAVKGSPSNVIGLPMHLVREMLTQAGFLLND